MKARLVFAVSLVLFGCSDKVVTSTGIVVSDGGAAAPTAAADSTDAGALPATRIAANEIGESEFIETDRTRDPFRSYATKFLEASRAPDRNERKVTLGEYSVDELKPIGIVMSSDYPRAMLIDPNGKGWVVKKGDYLGRPELVHLGGPGGTDYQVNWRVDRIRDGDIVLVREDPAQPGAAPITKVIPLRSEQDSL